MDTINQTLRLPPALAARLDRVADERGDSRHQVVLDTLVEAFPAEEHEIDPDLVLGFVALEGGEVKGVECPECGQPMSRPRIGFTAGLDRPLAFGPVCAVCADTL